MHNQPVSPIRPEDIKTVSFIPPEVIEAFNELIQEKFRSGRAVIGQEEVIRRILSKFEGHTQRQDIFKYHWLDVEPVFQAAGWQVYYDKPGFNESYEPTFSFRPAGTSNSRNPS